MNWLFLGVAGIRSAVRGGELLNEAAEGNLQRIGDEDHVVHEG